MYIKSFGIPDEQDIDIALAVNLGEIENITVSDVVGDSRVRDRDRNK